MRHSRIAILLAILICAPASAQTTDFFSGWENGGGLGCGNTQLTDNVTWDNFGWGDSGACAETPPTATIQTTEKVSGANALQVHFKTGDGGNGPDFRIEVTDLPLVTDFYASWCQKWDSNWRWIFGKDHKLMLFGPVSPLAQEFYFNIRGNAGETTGRPVGWVASVDSMRSDPAIAITSGVWHEFEVHIVTGATGSIEGWVDGVAIAWGHEAGNNIAYSNISINGPFGFVKPDTTYNCYSPASPNCDGNDFETIVPGGESNTYYDNIMRCTGGRCNNSCTTAGNFTRVPFLRR